MQKILKGHTRPVQKQIRQVANHIQANGATLDAPTILKLADLATWLEVSARAKTSLSKEGLTSLFNNGKTIGLNPTFKVLETSSKMVLKYLSELGIKATEVENEEEDKDWLHLDD